VFNLSSCKKKIDSYSPEQLFEKYNKSVVLIRNSYIYSIKINNSEAYFTDIKDDNIQDLTFDKDTAINRKNTIFGTGFFVSQDGKIATNRHVINPPINTDKVIENLKLDFINKKMNLKITKLNWMIRSST